MNICYQSFQNFPGVMVGNSPDYLKSFLNEYGCKRILEVGSGANPTLEPEYVRDNSLEYVTSDVSEEELEKADPQYERLRIDIEGAIDPSLHESFDLVFSRMVGEHIQDGEKYHKNIYSILRPGGLALHFMACIGGLPFLMNRILPEALTDGLQEFFAPRGKVQHAKFKAHYSWSFGPTEFMIKRLQSVGFEIMEYDGSFGHGYYSNRLLLVHRAELLKTNLLLKYPIPLLCTYATLVVRKPLSIS